VEPVDVAMSICLRRMVEEGHAIHYAAVERGTPVYSSDGVKLGEVDAVLDNYAEHILDGVIFETPEGELRFADGPEVARTAERAVTLAIDADAAAKLPPPEKAPPRFTPRRARGRLSRLLGGGWKRQ
jgi:hypothetical protein